MLISIVGPYFGVSRKGLFFNCWSWCSSVRFFLSRSVNLHSRAIFWWRSTSVIFSVRSASRILVFLARDMPIRIGAREFGVAPGSRFARPRERFFLLGGISANNVAPKGHGTTWVFTPAAQFNKIMSCTDMIPAHSAMIHREPRSEITGLLHSLGPVSTIPYG